MATFRVEGTITLHYHFCDVDVEADSIEDISEWDVLDEEFPNGWMGEMLEATFDDSLSVMEVDE